MRQVRSADDGGLSGHQVGRGKVHEQPFFRRDGQARHDDIHLAVQERVGQVFGGVGLKHRLQVEARSEGAAQFNFDALPLAFGTEAKWGGIGPDADEQGAGGGRTDGTATQRAGQSRAQQQEDWQAPAPHGVAYAFRYCFSNAS